MKKKKKRNLLLTAVFILLTAAELIYSNSIIDTEHINIKDDSIPSEFDGCVIAHISDYHSSGDSARKRLISAVAAQNPDYIFITGDICDSIRRDIDKANEFLAQISEIAPCFLVWGNHDITLNDDELDKMRRCAEENGITLLENKSAYLERNGGRMLITGTVNDIYTGKADEVIENYPEDDGFSIWLHHYPEDFGLIAASADVDLIFAGHAHGGLIRLPFTDGLYAPGQGMLPKYTSGLYEEYGSRMIVSRGVGNSGYTLRLFDRFHLIICTLEK